MFFLLLICNYMILHIIYIIFSKLNSSALCAIRKLCYTSVTVLPPCPGIGKCMLACKTHFPIPECGCPLILTREMRSFYIMKKHEHIVRRVEQGSIADELGIEAGDKLLAINGNEIEDIFDYQFFVEDEEILLLIEKPDGEEWELEIEKDADEQLGLDFGEGLMDEYRSCRNKCMFCFIDQMPKGMRDTLYFKDDDSRLSFLQGNYVTLTNMSDHDIDRIIRYRLEPINISFHTTNPELRCRMLHNRFAGECAEKSGSAVSGRRGDERADCSLQGHQ